jgi:hypothetical protein
MVPYVEVEPTPLDWSQSLVVGGCGGSRSVGKEVDLIMAFSQIVDVSCDGYIEKFGAAFSHILANKVKKMAKKIVGGSQMGKKGTRELVNLFSSVNYKGRDRSVTCSRGKGKGNHIVL